MVPATRLRLFPCFYYKAAFGYVLALLKEYRPMYLQLCLIQLFRGRLYYIYFEVFYCPLTWHFLECV